jgi:hypothetical protein
VGLEIWSMSDNILFDNFIITDDKIVSEQWAAETFDLKRNLVDRDQVSAYSSLDTLIQSNLLTL